MGDRGQVRIIEVGSPDLYYYTHWQATPLPAIVSNALERGRGRWGDTSYLNRIIFSEMVQHEILDTIGYGISTLPFEDAWRTVTIDHDNLTVTVTDSERVWTFDEFASKYYWVL
jgi:hypothetical protein